MKKAAETYLDSALKRLEKWLPFPADEMMEMYLDPDAEIQNWDYEEDAQGRVYLIFSWPETDSERVVLLVYDEQMRIIADLAAIHTDVMSLLYSKKLYDGLSEESDWMYLEHYTLCAALFDEPDYPPCLSETVKDYEGQTLLYTNAYVTRSFRRQGIFRQMIEMSREFALRALSGSASLYSVISLDPDVAVYGPDALSEPYHYSFEKDEPVRMQNREILARLGFETVRLEETEYDPEADGTKLWFAYRRETDLIIELKEQNPA